MILKFKSGTAIATGRVTKGGSSFQKVGAKGTSLWSASVQVEETKNEDGTWHRHYITIKAWRRKADAMPALPEGACVIVTGSFGVDSYPAADGTQRERETITIEDYDVCIPMPGFAPSDAYRSIQDGGGVPVFADLDDQDGELPF